LTGTPQKKKGHLWYYYYYYYYYYTLVAWQLIILFSKMLKFSKKDYFILFYFSKQLHFLTHTMMKNILECLRIFCFAAWNL